LGTLILEYQAEGAREWRKVPIRRPSLIGSETWDAGTAEPLRVRASVSDRAKNVAETSTTLPEGTASNPNLAANDPGELSAPPPISPISPPSGLPPVEEARPGPSDEPRDPFPAPPPAARSHAPPEDEADPFAGPGGGDPGAPAGNGPAPRGRSQSLLVGRPRFPPQYAGDDAGPDGPSVVEPRVTQ